tara:strand:+ start:59 stop:814 length:756 start_codon:yes stop_codon:yes gene_type:complete
MDCLNIINSNIFEKYNIEANNLENYLISFYLIGLAYSYLMMFYGYKILKPTLFLGGVVSGMVVDKYIIQLSEPYYVFDCKVYYWFITISCLLMGMVVLNLYKLGTFSVGGLAGGAIGYMSYNYISENISVIDKSYEPALVMIPALIGGFGLMYKQEYMSLLLTSFLGPLLNIVCVYYLVYLTMGTYLKDTNLFMVMCGIYYILMTSMSLYCQRRQMRPRNDNLLDGYEKEEDNLRHNCCYDDIELQRVTYI